MIKKIKLQFKEDQNVFNLNWVIWCFNLFILLVILGLLYLRGINTNAHLRCMPEVQGYVQPEEVWSASGNFENKVTDQRLTKDVKKFFKPPIVITLRPPTYLFTLVMYNYFNLDHIKRLS